MALASAARSLTLSRPSGQVVLKPLAVPNMQFQRTDGTSDALYAFELALMLVGPAFCGATSLCPSFDRSPSFLHPSRSPTGARLFDPWRREAAAAACGRNSG
jgi:hypothetical protein